VRISGLIRVRRRTNNEALRSLASEQDSSHAHLKIAACRFQQALPPVNIDRLFPDICDIVEMHHKESGSDWDAAVPGGLSFERVLNGSYAKTRMFGMRR
jgi:hypothetical protein